MSTGGDNHATPPLDLRQVLYFVTVADELSFTRAAGLLHISTSALSQQVKALERQLHVKLLIRDAQGVRLTAAGDVLAAAGRRLLEQGECAVAQTRKAAGLVTGGLSVASLHEMESVFEPYLTQFHTAYPDIRLSITAMRHMELLASVRSRAVDAGLTWSFLLDREGDTDGLRWRKVTATEVIACLSTASPWAALDRVPRGEALRGTPAALFERDYSPVTFDYVLEELYGTGAPTEPTVREVPVTVRAQETMVRHVAADTFAPLSRPVAESMRGSCEIRSFDPPWFLDGCVVWHQASASASLTAFLVTTERLRCGAKGHGARDEPVGGGAGQSP